MKGISTTPWIHQPATSPLSTTGPQTGRRRPPKNEKRKNLAQETLLIPKIRSDHKIQEDQINRLLLQHDSTQHTSAMPESAAGTLLASASPAHAAPGLYASDRVWGFKSHPNFAKGYLSTLTRGKLPQKPKAKRDGAVKGHLSGLPLSASDCWAPELIERGKLHPNHQGDLSGLPRGLHSWA